MTKPSLDRPRLASLTRLPCHPLAPGAALPLTLLVFPTECRPRHEQRAHPVLRRAERV